MSIVGGDSNLVAGLGAFCDAATRADIKRFFTDHPLPAASRRLDQTLERINNCINLREKQTGVVAQWLDSH